MSESELPRPNGASAYAAATLALFGAPAMAAASFLAFMESENTKPYDVERDETLQALACCFGISALLLFPGATLLLRGAPVGRGLIAIGAGFAVLGHALGFYLLTFVMNPGYPIDQSITPTAAAFFLALLAFPVVTLWCALAKATTVWLGYRYSPSSAG